MPRNTKAVVGRVGREKEEKKKKIQFHVPSWNNRLTSEHFQMKIFFLSFLMSFIELHYED